VFQLDHKVVSGERLLTFGFPPLLFTVQNNNRNFFVQEEVVEPATKNRLVSKSPTGQLRARFLKLRKRLCGCNLRAGENHRPCEKHTEDRQRHANLDMETRISLKQECRRHGCKESTHDEAKTAVNHGRRKKWNTGFHLYRKIALNENSISSHG